MRVYSFEANPASYKLLKRTLWWELGSSEHNITTKCALVSDREGRAEIFHRGAADLEASASPGTATEGGKPLEKSSEVDAVSLDGLFAAGGRRIHLLKVDTEGFDPVVLRGASQLLSQRLVKFLVFEYSSKWRLAGHKLTLKGVVGKLEQQGYSCFFMKPHVLVPLTGKWWQDVYELKHQIFVVNVFCGQTADHDLFDAYVGFGTSSYTLLYALANLQISGSPDQAEA
uniref:Methyltransferase FkbM domain-containing protein n=1 Tax=Alexandrium catenella TaxID=2925 RepID=A0A7S1W681_ALECA